jgi:HPr kinase/phosphorylase
LGQPVQSISIRQLLDECQESLQLDLRAGASGLSREIRVPRIQKPGLALTGYEEQLDNERLLTLGGTEIEFLEGASDDQRKIGIATVLGARPAAIVITRGLEPPDALLKNCEREGVPLFVSSLVSSEFILNVTHVLQQHLSPTTSVHGVFMDVLGVGVLLLGKSGIGKSEAALDLVVRGARLVADDVVEVRRIGPNLLVGEGSGIIKHHMEIRGLGIINIKDLFGIAAVREQHQIDLVIELCEWSESEEYDRLGVEAEDYGLLGEEVPLLRVPVRPGRNLATIIEVAARNQILKLGGHNSARIFQRRLKKAIAEGAR